MEWKGKVTETVAEEGIQTTSPHMKLLNVLQAMSVTEHL